MSPAGKSQGLFARRATIVVVVVAVASLAVSVLALAFGPELADVPSAGADAFSPSAIGHEAFIRILRDLDIPVVIGRRPHRARASDAGLLVIAEPRPFASPDGDEKLRARIRGAKVVLLVLPRRRGPQEPAEKRPEWLAASAELPASEVAKVLGAVGIEGSVVRDRETSPFSFDGPFRSAPRLPEPQLVTRGDDLTPLIHANEGVLLAEVDDPEELLARAARSLRRRVASTVGGPQKLYILADPDLISTHGLGRGDNAVLAVSIVERLRAEAGGGAVVIDETLHGYELERGLLREMLDFPLALAVIQGVVAAAALVWAGVRRVGAPVPLAPALGAGKEPLIGNTAELFRYAGHTSHALARYLGVALREVGDALHAPAGLGRAELRDWLARAAAARGVRVDVADVAERVQHGVPSGPAGERIALGLARRVHEFREEMLHGRRGR